MNATETTARAAGRARLRAGALIDAGGWALAGALGLVVAAGLAFFAIHAAHLLRYPYPLDYGEGPLLAQVGQLLAGAPIWRIYADPGLPPYLVVNYPPVYQVLAALLARLTGDALLAGRLISLGAALASTSALWALSHDPGAAGAPRARPGWPATMRLLIALCFLALPITREWAALMRVDLLGVALGLGGLLLVQRGCGRDRALWAALPLLLSLYVKPSLIAAPAAALAWLFFRDRRRALILAALLAGGGGLIFALLQIASGGWFALNILDANTNEWQRRLAYGFWHDQMLILWPLPAAALVGLLARRLRSGGDARALLPLYYALFGALSAFGVGKVGAYANYFLEFYAGLIWLAASVAWRPPAGASDAADARRAARGPALATGLAALLLIAALLRYYPTWSATYLKLAGIIEGSNPPRLAFGRYGILQDLRRERDILQTLAGVNAAPAARTSPASAAVQAGQLARLQAFEHRQLLDAGRWDQRPLLRDLANGRVPLVVLDYLGNWLTPQMIAVITHRYAQDGSRGTYDLYRPVDPGPLIAAARAFPGGPQLVGYRLAPSPGSAAYHAGEIVALTLEWRAPPEDRGRPAPKYAVVARLLDARGAPVAEAERPLLYGALDPSGWGDDPVQHMQSIALPPDLPPARYALEISLRADGRDLAPPGVVAQIDVERQGGRVFGAAGAFVPAPLLAAWERAESGPGYGDPLMPATPLPGATLQCFVRACLRLAGGDAQRLPLGELIHLGDAGLAAAPSESGAEQRFAETGQSLRGPFLDYWRANGGAEAFGPPITPELIRNGLVVQYTRYARLERLPDGALGLGRLGEEFLRLPGGVAYRWP